MAPSPVHGISRRAISAYHRLDSVMRRDAMATVMVVEDDPAFLTRFCRIIASDPDLELFAAVPDRASARQALHKFAPGGFFNGLRVPGRSRMQIILHKA